MKFFLIVSENFDYDEYDGVVVAAESKEEALDMLDYYKNGQGEIELEDVTEKGIDLPSFMLITKISGVE